MIENIMLLSKVRAEEKINYINYIDAELNVQRIFLRIMYKNQWIDEKRFKVASDLIYELGKLVGGLLKFYGQNIKK